VRRAIRRAAALAAALLGLWACEAWSASQAPLVRERTIPLPGVAGRIDHLSVDAQRKRLFVAELGNGTLEAVDLAGGRSLGRIAGLKEPQGVGYLPARDELAVATGGDGMLRFYRASDLKLTGSLKLGEDADNVRVDGRTGRVLVGYGKALALVDPAARKVLRTVPLPAHPEGFQVLQDRVIVNLPDAGALGVFDLAQGRELARWRNPGPHFNFPLALDPDAGRVAVVYRLPARLVLFSAASGAVEQQLDACGDADDVFFDGKRRRIYVVCGGGSVDVFERTGTVYRAAGQITTRRGARTGLFSPELDRLFVAARLHGADAAGIIVFAPAP
jgi:hypothetical protein